MNKGKHQTAPADAHSPSSAREIASRKLADQARKWPEFNLTPLPDQGLDDRDAALANAIYDAGMRRWITLEWLLDRHLEQPLKHLEPPLQGVLIAGAAQLVLFDRIPVHAAIDESVELAGSLVRSGAKGLANAVLRRVAESIGERRPGFDSAAQCLPLADGSSVALNGPTLPEQKLPRLGIITSHPAWLLKRWAARHPWERVQRLALHSLVNAPTIINTAYAQGPMPESLIQHQIRGSHVFTGSRSDLSTLLNSRRDLWVQDPASSRPIAGASTHLDIRAGLIIDLCAGQGTKTRQLAAAFPGASIIATDIDERRLTRLAEAFAGDSQVQVVGPQDLVLKYHGKADLVLLDVPCTNTGVLARRVEAKYRCDDEQLDRLTAIQKQVVADAIPLLRSRPRGRILYATCSLEPEENQAHADWAARWHNFKVIAHESNLPEGSPGERPEAYRDGSFWSLLG